MRIGLLLVVFLCLSSPALAFRGRVVDREGKPVPNATVSVLGRTGEAITDARRPLRVSARSANAL